MKNNISDINMRDPIGMATKMVNAFRLNGFLKRLINDRRAHPGHRNRLRPRLGLCRQPHRRQYPGRRTRPGLGLGPDRLDDRRGGRRGRLSAIASGLGFGREMSLAHASAAGFWLFAAFVPFSVAACIAAWRLSSTRFVAAV